MLSIKKCHCSPCLLENHRGNFVVMKSKMKLAQVVNAVIFTMNSLTNHIGLVSPGEDMLTANP